MLRHRRHITIAMTAAILGVTAIAVPAASAGDAGGPQARAAGTCSGTFQVLHNDRIGKASFPRGPYKLHTSRTRCSTAARLFARFLDDVDGDLPGGWFVTKIDGNWGFRQKGKRRDILPVPLGKPSGQVCSGTYDIKHSVKINGHRVRSGRYQIKRVGRRAPSCGSAANVLSKAITRGKVVPPWKFNSRTLTIFKGRLRSGGSGFQLVNRKRIGGGGGGGGGGTTGGYACRGFFEVVRSTTIAGPTIKPSRGVRKLRLPHGDYKIVILKGGRISCSHAVERFKAFLNRAEVSKPWKIQLSTATFYRNAKRDVGFRANRIPGASRNGNGK